MVRSGIRDSAVQSDRPPPDFAALHPGYDACVPPSRAYLIGMKIKVVVHEAEELDALDKRHERT
jgi:hypothetical protein